MNLNNTKHLLSFIKREFIQVNKEVFSSKYRETQLMREFLLLLKVPGLLKNGYKIDFIKVIPEDQDENEVFPVVMCINGTMILSLKHKFFEDEEYSNIVEEVKERSEREMYLKKHYTNNNLRINEFLMEIEFNEKKLIEI